MKTFEQYYAEGERYFVRTTDSHRLEIFDKSLWDVAKDSEGCSAYKEAYISVAEYLCCGEKTNSGFKICMSRWDTTNNRRFSIDEKVNVLLSDTTWSPTSAAEWHKYYYYNNTIFTKGE